MTWHAYSARTYPRVMEDRPWQQPSGAGNQLGHVPEKLQPGFSWHGSDNARRQLQAGAVRQEKSVHGNFMYSLMDVEQDAPVCLTMTEHACARVRYSVVVSYNVLLLIMYRYTIHQCLTQCCLSQCCLTHCPCPFVILGDYDLTSCYC
jgi:hypothetical protein